MSRYVLILEGADGGTVAVVCNSLDAADLIREASPLEALGTIPVVSRVDAILGK